MTLENIVLRFIQSGSNVRRHDIFAARLGKRDEVRRVLAELNQTGKIWLIGDGTIEVAGKVAKL